MKYDDFKTLTEDEQRTLVESIDGLNASIGDLTAERNSLKTENETLTGQVNSLNEEMAKTKEMNFTLTRKLNLNDGSSQSVEDILHDMFMTKKGDK